MKKAAKYLMLIAILSCCSCVKYVKCNYDREYVLTNETDKDFAFVYSVSSVVHFYDDYAHKPTFSVGDTTTNKPYQSDTIQIWHDDNGNLKLRVFIKPHDQEGTSFKYLLRAADRGFCTAHESSFSYRSYYNLTDTTSIKLWENTSYADTSFDGLVCSTRLVSASNSVYSSVITIRLTDSALALMEKDTSMLRLFPEYYGTAK